MYISFLNLWICIIIICSLHLDLSSGTIICADGYKEIKDSYLCDTEYDCADSSDEEETFCKAFNDFKSTRSKMCSDDKFYDNYYGNCYDIMQICKEIKVKNDQPGERLCRMIDTSNKKLYLYPECSNNTQLAKVVDHLETLYEKSALKCSKDATEVEADDSCPPFYTRVGDSCLSFFSIARVTWYDAQHFCKSISGELAVFSDVNFFINVVRYIRQENLAGDFWIGGKVVEKTVNISSWEWTDKTAIEMGAPFWAVSNTKKNCNTNGEKMVCQTFELFPLNSTAGFCAGLTYDNYFYFSDHNCLTGMSPLCVYNQTQQNSLEQAKKVKVISMSTEVPTEKFSEYNWNPNGF